MTLRLFDLVFSGTAFDVLWFVHSILRQWYELTSKSTGSHLSWQTLLFVHGLISAV